MNALDAVAASMAADTTRMAAVSQNLANAGTPAYKRDVARAHAFSSLYEPLALPGQPAQPAAATAREASRSTTDMRAGTLRHTGQALDVAIESAATFFEVQTPDGPAYTRRGDFTVDAEGRLCDHAGHPVMGQGGLIGMLGNSPVIGPDGRIQSGGRELGRLRLVQFTDEAQMQRLPGSLFLPGGATPAEAQNATVRQHHLEVSNVDSAAEMVTLMETMRHFEAGQKLVQGMDDMLERALRKLGEF